MGPVFVRTRAFGGPFRPDFGRPLRQISSHFSGPSPDGPTQRRHTQTTSLQFGRIRANIGRICPAWARFVPRPSLGHCRASFRSNLGGVHQMRADFGPTLAKFRPTWAMFSWRPQHLNKCRPNLAGTRPRLDRATREVLVEAAFWGVKQEVSFGLKRHIFPMVWWKRRAFRSTSEFTFLRHQLSPTSRSRVLRSSRKPPSSDSGDGEAREKRNPSLRGMPAGPLVAEIRARRSHCATTWALGAHFLARFRSGPLSQTSGRLWRSPPSSARRARTRSSFALPRKTSLSRRVAVIPPASLGMYPHSI